MMRACGVRSQHCREVFRRKNARLGNQVDAGFDRGRVNLSLLACTGNRRWDLENMNK